MDNTVLGKTTLEHIPVEILSPKRKTNRTWTLIIIILIAGLCWLFWLYRSTMIYTETFVVVPVQSQQVQTEDSMIEIQNDLAETEIPAFHETL